MEGGFRALLLGDEEGSTTSPPAFHSAVDDGCYYTTADASHSFLSSTTEEKHLLQLFDYGYGGVDPSSFGYLLGEEGCRSSVHGGRRSIPADFGAGEEDLMKPKLEFLRMAEFLGVSPHEEGCGSSGGRRSNPVGFFAGEDDLTKPELYFPRTEPFEMKSKGSEHVIRLYDFGSRKLPDLRSLEQFQAGEASRKRAKPSPATNQRVSTFESLVAEKKTKTSSSSTQRRQKISEKTKCLQKVLPFEKKMDTATMLGEAYKYIKFLQAQVSVLQSMPCDSSRFVTQNQLNDVYASGGLGKLNRQQLLEVLVNSPVVQTVLSSQGRCVYSVEQLALMQRMVSGNDLLLRQMMVMDYSMLG